MEILVITLMLILSAFFSGAEIAFVAANRLKGEARARRGGLIGGIVSDFLHDPPTVLTTTLVGNNLSLVLYSTLMAVMLEDPLRDFCTHTLNLGTGVELAVISLQTFIASLLVLIFGEILPKSILQQVADRAIFILAIPLKIWYWLLLPFVKIAGWAASILIRLIGRDRESMNRFLRRDFEVLLSESKASGQLELDDEESFLVANVFLMSSLRVKESMIPRTDIEAAEDTATLDDVRRLFQSTGFSKLPIYQENIDHIIGVVFAYDLFTNPATLAEMIRPVRFVPETKHSKDLLRELLAEGVSIAIVIDEYGGTAGMVTVEDLIEELTGDIQDEFDTEEFMVRQLDEQTFVINGRAEVDELKEKYDISLPDGDYETIAGYVLDQLGYFPEASEEHILSGHRFVILKAANNRIDLIKFFRGSEEE